MAMIDYGAVEIKNGKIINENETFCNMEKALGFSVDFAIDEKRKWNRDGKFRVNENHFAYAGNKELFYCFYKESVAVIRLKDGKYMVDKVLYSEDFNNLSGYNYFEENIRVSIMHESSGRYTAYIDTNGNEYIIYFGYGVDCNYKTQLSVAWDYGFSKYEIENVSRDVWKRPVAVVNIKRKKNCYYNKKYSDLTEKYEFYYKYKKVEE